MVVFIITMLAVVPMEIALAPLQKMPPACTEFWERWDAAAALNNEPELDRMLEESESNECDTHRLLGEGQFSE